MIDELKKVLNVPYAIIIASFIIIIITTNITDQNGLSALIGGYSGLLFGMLFIIILNMTYIKVPLLQMFPLIIILCILSLLIYYLSRYFENISKGEVSDYYFSFSLLSTIFLITQTVIIFNALYNNSNELKLFSDTTLSILGLFGVLNFIIVVTMGIVLHFYSTQG